ncbi:hypothetical protein [Paracoccus halophilus]|uniref:hypothetical protein n=1 Tax=Paracoccus halophilus TaxID=376733 RepID=UPI001E54622A|nr:hypothetical protein [Paracoccus halophilus]
MIAPDAGAGRLVPAARGPTLMESGQGKLAHPLTLGKRGRARRRSGAISGGNGQMQGQWLPRFARQCQQVVGIARRRIHPGICGARFLYRGRRDAGGDKALPAPVHSGSFRIYQGADGAIHRAQLSV